MFSYLGDIIPCSLCWLDLVKLVFQWQKLTADEVKETIYKLSKKGLTPSQIGVILRDSHGVNQVRFDF